MTAAAPAPTDLKSTLEEMRASVAGEGMCTRLDAMIQDAFLAILNLLLAWLAEFRAGRLAPVAPAVETAPSAAGPAAAPTPAPPIAPVRRAPAMRAPAMRLAPRPSTAEANGTAAPMRTPRVCAPSAHPAPRGGPMRPACAGIFRPVGLVRAAVRGVLFKKFALPAQRIGASKLFRYKNDMIERGS